MKRPALIVLTVIYLLSLVGIGVNRFYCCSKLASVSLSFALADHTDKNNCCKHESKCFKVKDSHVAVKITVLSRSSRVLLLAPAYVAFNISLTAQVVQTAYHAKAPPGNPDIPIYTLNCNYRI